MSPVRKAHPGRHTKVSMETKNQRVIVILKPQNVTVIGSNCRCNSLPL
jgi:hypothetical protein